MKFVQSLVAFVVCFIPVWVYLLARLVFSPTGFWQNLVLFGLGIWILGGIQFLLFIGFIIWMFSIWGN